MRAREAIALLIGRHRDLVRRRGRTAYNRETEEALNALLGLYREAGRLYRENGEWYGELNDSWMEDYKINDYYLKMMKESGDEEEAWDVEWPEEYWADDFKDED